MTFRELLRTTKREDIFDYMKKTSTFADPENPNPPTIEEIYGRVIDEMLACPVVEQKYPIIITEQKEMFLDEETKKLEPQTYFDVAWLNPDFVEPPEGLEPWGCKEGEEPPEGHYDINDEKYSKYLGMGMSPWEEFMESTVINETGLTDAQAVAEILFEATFYGSTQEKIKEFRDELKRRADNIEDSVPMNMEEFRKWIDELTEKEIDELGKDDNGKKSKE